MLINATIDVRKAGRMQVKNDIRVIISKNIVWLMNSYGMSRKTICNELGIKYTTLCDWIAAKTYPRVDALEALAEYFSVDVSMLFTDIQNDENLVKRLTEYSKLMLNRESFENTYPAGFFNLFGSLKDTDIPEPEDLAVEEREWIV